MSYFNSNPQDNELLGLLKNKDGFDYDFKCQYGKIINDLVIEGLEKHNIHLVKGQEFVIEQNKIGIKLERGFGSNFIEYIVSKIIENVLYHCDDQVVMFWDFFNGMSFYENHYTTSFNDMGRNNIVINCGYRFIDKNHTSITPPKNMVKMYMNYEKQKFEK
jgi:hypothetical protein